jgi:two-component system, cell cycle response regulator DivK
MNHDPILVVDDNPVNRKLARVLLECEGYDVRVAADAEEAVMLLEAQAYHPRLILLDLRLPRMGGLELTRRLKAHPHTKEIVVVALTGATMEEDEVNARAAGCDGYIAKPIDTTCFAALVAKHLEPCAGAAPLSSVR